MIKLNIGASPIWRKDGWSILDHKLKESKDFEIAGDAENIDLEDESCDIIFISHVFEHIPHIRLPIILSEINRVLKKDGILRILTPDLRKIATAYVNNDGDFFKKAKLEDESIRTDLGYGGMFMNFVVSPGQDTALINRSLNKFISGYAHLYNYDYEMLSKIMEFLGFSTRQAKFCDSTISELREPLHIEGFEPKWENLNQEFYSKNNLVHKYIDGEYKINFKVTGFDRDPITSLIIEAKKLKFVSKEDADQKYNKTMENYNRYAYSLLNDKFFKSKLESLNIKT